MKYNIMVIDDEFDLRKTMYENFLMTVYPDIEIQFQIFVIEYARDAQSSINKLYDKIDAFFIDARLDKKEKGWNEDQFGVTFNEILSFIENIYSETYIPPIFMISKHWTDESQLFSVSRSFSVFHRSIQPCRYFSENIIRDILKESTEMNADGKIHNQWLREERGYIYNEIEKVKKQLKVTEIRVDIVLIFAVADEKDMAYKVFGIEGITPTFESTYRFFYNIATVDNINVALIMQQDMGMTSAGVTATSAILAFKPKLIAMTGICAGKKTDTKLADIIIPSEVFDYSRGKKNINGTEFRATYQQLGKNIFGYVQNNVNAELLNKIRIGFAFGDYPNRDISIHTKPLATGTWVVNDPEVLEAIGAHIQGNCIGLDMEAYAIALAAHTFDTSWMILKSVQDYADGNKDQDELPFRKFAAYSSAKLLHELIPGLMNVMNK